jgi:hypothetical protein
MIRLDNTTRTLQALLSGSVTTNQLNTTTSYSDATSSTFTGATTVINTNNTTAVTLAAAPSAGIVRTIDSVNVFNADTVSQTVTVRYNDNGTFYPLIRTTLLTGETLIYTHGSGWAAIDANGNRKEVTASVFSSLTVTGSATFSTGAFSSTITLGGNAVITGADGANILALKNGTAAQTLRVYGTTSGSKYALLSHNGVNGIIGLDAADALLVQFAGATYYTFAGSQFYPYASGFVDLGSNAGGGWRNFFMDYTNTATIGAVTINKSAGRVNVAAAATSVVVTNSQCTAASLVFAVAAQNDTTAQVKNVVAGVGSFTINLTAAATANCAINFFIVKTD